MTQRGVRKQRTFFNDGDYQCYLDFAVELLTEIDIKLWAYCLMPNHIHAVVVPSCGDSMSSFFAKLHRRYARRTNAINDWSGHLWQERFFSVAMDEPHTLAAMRYVEMNPVRSGLVRHPEDWPWSSAGANLGQRDDRLVSRDDTRDVVPDWRGYLGRRENPQEVDELRRQTRVGRPEGTEAFIEGIERATGRDVRKRRKRKAQKR